MVTKIEKNKLAEEMSFNTFPLAIVVPSASAYVTVVSCKDAGYGGRSHWAQQGTGIWHSQKLKILQLPQLFKIFLVLTLYLMKMAQGLQTALTALVQLFKIDGMDSKY